jgi:DNA-binding GntR family transcriptional regulator
MSRMGGFLYQSVMQTLRTRITNGEYRPGTRIPSKDELATEFGVSTITIRRAIRDLSLAGLVIGRQGLGVFVSHKRRIVRSLNADGIAPIEEEMRASGVEPGLRDMGITLTSASEEPFLANLERAGTQIYRLDRLLLADAEVVGFDTIWMPLWVADQLKNSLRGEFIMSQLEEHGLTVKKIDYQVEAASATESQAPLLNIITGAPLLVVRFFPVGESGLPFLVGRTITRAEKFTYEFSAPVRHRSNGSSRRSAGSRRR